MLIFRLLVMESVARSPLGQGVGLPFSPDFFIMGLSFLTGLSFYWGHMVGRSGLVSACCGATLRVQVFLKLRPHTRPVLLKRPWSPPEIEGICPSCLHGADGGACRLLCAVHQMLSLWSLYRCGSWSPRPQPLGSGGDATPCEDTRGDHELLF